MNNIHSDCLDLQADRSLFFARYITLYKHICFKANREFEIE